MKNLIKNWWRQALLPAVIVLGFLPCMILMERESAEEKAAQQVAVSEDMASLVKDLLEVKSQKGLAYIMEVSRTMPPFKPGYRSDTSLRYEVKPGWKIRPHATVSEGGPPPDAIVLTVEVYKTGHEAFVGVDGSIATTNIYFDLPAAQNPNFANTAR